MNIFIIGNSFSKIRTEEFLMLCDLFDHKSHVYYTPNNVVNEFKHIDDANCVVVFEVNPQTTILIGYAYARGVRILSATDDLEFLNGIEFCKSVPSIFAKVVKQ